MGGLIKWPHAWIREHTGTSKSTHRRNSKAKERGTEELGSKQLEKKNRDGATQTVGS